MATQQQAAEHIFLSERRFRELVDDGVISRRPKGGYDLRTVRREAFKHLRHRAAGTGGEGLAVARTGLAEQQTQAIAFKNAIASGRYVEITAAIRILTENLLVFKERLLNALAPLAYKLADGDLSLAAKFEAILTDTVHEILAELAEGAWIVERAVEQQRAGRR